MVIWLKLSVLWTGTDISPCLLAVPIKDGSWANRYHYLPVVLTLPMLRLLSSKPQCRKDFWKPSDHCHVGIHRKALTEHFRMSTRLPGFQSFFRFLHDFVLVELTTTSIRVKLKSFHWANEWIIKIIYEMNAWRWFTLSRLLKIWSKNLPSYTLFILDILKTFFLLGNHVVFLPEGFDPSIQAKTR